MNQTIKVALVDDHVLLRKGLADLVRGLDYEVLFEADNGLELETKMNKANPPDIVLMDINMPNRDGFESTCWLKENFPLVKVLALTMYEDEDSVIRMIRNGARGYVVKDIEPQHLKSAIDSVCSKGFYYSDLVTGKLVHSLWDKEGNEKSEYNIMNKLNDREIHFLKLAASEMTYKEIAVEMHLSVRTIDGYRDTLFDKLNIKSRVGLVIFAIKHGIVRLK
ncbi:MAG: response regulator transcription factor [Chitinophagaceae bacterium]|nr:MAG: response regulator transcription factor [Chitinophagaceae bacterium]